MHRDHVELFVCPLEGTPLALEESESDGPFVRTGALVSPAGRSYPIRDFVPRFSGEGYASNFSVEWEKHATILHQVTSGYEAYERRFRTETKWPDDLSGELILEAGCGPGAITPYPLQRGATVVSFDLSSSVERARQAIGAHERSLFVQASVYSLPFRRETFDRAFCFGVVQHTPDPLKTFRALLNMLKPGGSIAADSYVMPDPNLPGGHKLLRSKYRARRLGLHRLPPHTLHLLVRAYVSVLWPFHKRAMKSSEGLEKMWAWLFEDYIDRLPGMDPERFKEFAVLDIFDYLSPAYDIPQTVDGFRAFFAGLDDVDVHPGWNGVEGRGRKSYATS